MVGKKEPKIFLDISKKYIFNRSKVTKGLKDYASPKYRYSYINRRIEKQSFISPYYGPQKEEGKKRKKR